MPTHPALPVPPSGRFGAAAVGGLVAGAVATGVLTAHSLADAALAVAAATVGGLALLAGVLAVDRAVVGRHELAAMRRTLTSLALTSHDVLWRTDRAGRLEWTNAGVDELLGYRPDELVGRAVTEVIDPVQLPLWRRQARDFARQRTGWYDVPLRLVDRAGGLCLVEVSAEPILDRRGELNGFEGSLRAISDSRAQTLRLAEQRRQVGGLLAADAATIAFQPIVSLADNRVVGVEALTRFAGDPYVPPDVWFARAAEVGLGVALELRSMRAALAALPSLPPTVYVSLNASPRTIADPAFLDLLYAKATPLERLVLEITEHESIEDYAPLAAVLDTARQRGLRLAVDDAGAGYASFRHIVQLRPDHIKLDRELTAGMDRDPARRALASAVVVFALELDASVTAEGVETAEQLDTLRSLSVDAAQGYYLGAPSADPFAWRGWPRGRLQMVDRVTG